MNEDSGAIGGAGYDYQWNIGTFCLLTVILELKKANKSTDFIGMEFEKGVEDFSIETSDKILFYQVKSKWNGSLGLPSKYVKKILEKAQSKRSFIGITPTINETSVPTQGVDYNLVSKRVVISIYTNANSSSYLSALAEYTKQGMVANFKSKINKYIERCTNGIDGGFLREVEFILERKSIIEAEGLSLGPAKGLLSGHRKLVPEGFYSELATEIYGLVKKKSTEIKGNRKISKDEVNQMIDEFIKNMEYRINKIQRPN